MVPYDTIKGPERGSRASVNVPEAYHRELVLNQASNHLLALGCGSFCQNHVPEVVSHRSHNVFYGEMCPVCQRWLLKEFGVLSQEVGHLWQDKGPTSS